MSGDEHPRSLQLQLHRSGAAPVCLRPVATHELVVLFVHRFDILAEVPVPELLAGFGVDAAKHRPLPGDQHAVGQQRAGDPSLVP